MSVEIFSNYDIEKHADALANFLPDGDLFRAKKIDNSVMRLLLKGLSVAHKDLDDLLVLFSTEIDVINTTYLLDEWEQTLGIPDKCFTISGKTLSERRNQIAIKLASMGVQTDADFIALAALFGVTVTSITGGTTDLTTTHTMTVTAGFTSLDTFDTSPYDLPAQAFDGLPFHFIGETGITQNGFRFGSVNGGAVECLFNQLKPANVQLIFA